MGLSVVTQVSISLTEWILSGFSGARLWCSVDLYEFETILNPVSKNIKFACTNLVVCDDCLFKK